MSGGNKREQDPLNPENDIFWDPELLKAGPPPPPPRDAYSLKAVDPAPRIEGEEINVSTTLKRAAGPAGPAGPYPNQQYQQQHHNSGPDPKRMRESGPGPGGFQGNNTPTDGFRKLYVAALHQHTTEKDLESYFTSFGPVQHTQVLRDKETGMTKGFGFVTMRTADDTKKILSQSVHIVDNRTIRVSLTRVAPGKTNDYKPKNPRIYEEKIELIHEVGKIDVREGRIYIGQLPDNVSPNILASEFSKYGLVDTSNVSRAIHNTMKKSFGFVNFKETMAVKRVLQNPRHYIHEQHVDITLSKFGMETLLSDSIIWLWGLDWSINEEDLHRFFTQFGAVYHAMHIHNPVNGEKRGYGFVDFIEDSSTKKALAAAHERQNRFEVKGQQGRFGKFLPQKTKRDLMYIEDRFGNLLLKQMYNKVPESGTWGGGKDYNDSIRKGGPRTVTCRLPKQMLPVVVGDFGKIVTDVARDSKTKITLIKAAPQETACMFHIVGSEENCKTAQYIMKIKIKEKMENKNASQHSR